MPFDPKNFLQQRINGIANALQTSLPKLVGPASVKEEPSENIALTFTTPAQAIQFCRNYYNNYNGGKPPGKNAIEQKGNQVVIKNKYKAEFLEAINYQGPKSLAESFAAESHNLTELALTNNAVFNYNANFPPKSNINGVEHKFPGELQFADAEKAAAFVKRLGVNDNYPVIQRDNRVLLNAAMPYQQITQALGATPALQHDSSQTILTKLQQHHPQPKPAVNVQLTAPATAPPVMDYSNKGPKASLAQYIAGQLEQDFQMANGLKTQIKWDKDGIVIDFGKINYKLMNELVDYYAKMNPGLPMQFDNQQIKIPAQAVDTFLNNIQYAGPKPNLDAPGHRASLAAHMFQSLQNTFELEPKKININWTEKGLVIEMPDLTKKDMQAVKEWGKELHLKQPLAIEGNKITIKAENISDFLTNIKYNGPTPKFATVEQKTSEAPQPVMAQTPTVKV